MQLEVHWPDAFERSRLLPVVLKHHILVVLRGVVLQACEQAASMHHDVMHRLLSLRTATLLLLLQQAAHRQYGDLVASSLSQVSGVVSPGYAH